MSDYLQKIIYLSQSDYDTLAQGTEENPTSVTKNGVTLTNLDENYLYVTDGGVTNNDISGVISVLHGGTGKDTLLSGQVLVGNGENPITTIVKTSANTANTLVERNANGDFSARNITMTQGNIGSMTLSGTTIAALTAINTTGGNGLLAYKPSSWTGVSSSQWGVGTVDIQGVIRSNNSDLLHSRAGTNSVILDAGNYKTYAYALDGSNTGTKLQISTQSAAYTNGIQFMNSTTKKGSLGADNNGVIGIYGTKVVLRPQLDASTKGVEITADAMYSTDSMTLGTTSNKWSTIYGTTFDGAILKLHQGTAADPSLSGNARIEFDYSNGQPIVISYTPNDGYRAPAGLKIMGGASASPAWLEVEGNIYAAAFKGNADTATAATRAATLSCPEITTETAIQSGTRSYQGSGSEWTGTVTSMRYAGILQICGGYDRGWQIWAERGDNATKSLHWRNPNSAANAWNAERIILDSGNYTNYAVAKTAGVTAVTWDATNKKLTCTINGTAADVMTAAQMSTALGLGTIASKAATDYLPVKYSNLDYTSATTSMGVYPINQTHPVTGKTEYGGAIQFGGISTSNNYYAAQLLVSSESGGTSPVHAYIRRMTSTPTWSNWTALLDSNNYTDYTVTKTGSGASGSWGISITGSSTSCTGNAATATKSGVAAIWLYPENNNEINFGGTNTSTTIYFGYRTKDSRAIPAKFVFGSSTGTADLQAKTVYLGSGTTSYISSTQYTGNAASATKVVAKLATTTKTYLLGTSTAITATAANVEMTGDTGVYLTTTAGQLNATTYLVNEKVRMEYNSTDQSLDFIFI